MIKQFAKGILRCGWRFISMNYFNNHIKRKKNCYIFPYRGSIIDINGLVVLNGNFEFNAMKYKHSNAESYLSIANNATMTVNGNVRINYGSTIKVNRNASFEVGRMTSNVGLNIQCNKFITIGADCMIGRNVAIFDSAFHPTGMSSDYMEISEEEVKIGNHVWVGAYSFISKGSCIGDGTVIGSHVYVGGNVDKASTIMRKDDKPSLIGNMWARSLESLHIQEAVAYYDIKREKESDNKIVNRYYQEIVNILKDFHIDIHHVEQGELLTKHVIDSLSLIQLVGLLEEHFSVHIPYNEITLNNFNDVNGMTRVIGKLKKMDANGLFENEAKIEEESHKENNIKPSDTLLGYVSQHAKHRPQAVAVISNRVEYSYSWLWDTIKKYGTFLITQGLSKGDVIVVKSSQNIEYIIIYLAIHYANGVVTTLEKTSSWDKIIHTAEAINAKMIIADEIATPIQTPTICICSASLLQDVNGMRQVMEINFPFGDNTADILFTTGTTGDSKGVELSHRAVVAGAENIAFGCEMTNDTVLVVPNPLSHSNAIKNLGACFITGSAFSVLDGITDLNAYFEALDYPKGKIATVLPPAAIRYILQLAKDKFANYKTTLNYLMSAMAPLVESDREVLRELFPYTRLYNHYGCSESSSICIYDFNRFPDLKNCVGKVMPHSRVFFVDDSRAEIVSSSSNLGLLAVEGDATMKGYFRDPELTKKIKEGKVIYTRDIGYMDEKGFVYVLGRSDDIINVGGLKVSPLEVEEIALAYTGIIDCICIGVDDAIAGQAVKLLVVPATDFDMHTFKAYLLKSLEVYKVPRTIEIVEEIARTYNGKLDRKFYKREL